ncbi:MAG: alcohol dehydrogenase catalytic domain-containing protein [Lachnospiraceae bacterium]
MAKKFWNKYKEYILYLFFGGMTTAVNYAVYVPLTEFIHMPVVAANSISWTAAVAFAYLTNRKWVFDSKARGFKPILREIVLFALARVASLLIENLILWVFVDILRLNNLIIKLIASAVTIILNYIFSKFVIFRRKKRRGSVRIAAGHRRDIMKQALMTEPGNIIIQEVPAPKAGPGEVLIKIDKIGVCGSDIHVWHGKHPYTSYPVVQGHEIAATVVAAGEGVSGFEAGELVTVMPQVVCGKCYPCTHGLYNNCEVLKVRGFQTTGLASEFFACPADWMLKLPQGMNPDHGAMIEPLACAVHAVKRVGDVNGLKAAVMGGGTIGNLCGQTLIALGAEKVLVSEISACRLEIAGLCGLTTYNPQEIPLKDAINTEFGPDGADIIFECIGNGQTLNHAIEIARKGSTVIVMGVVADPYPVNMGFVQDHELNVLGTAMYRREDWETAIDLANKGLIKLAPLVTHHVPFDEYETAYRLIEEQKDKAMKVIIDL